MRGTILSSAMVITTDTSENSLFPPSSHRLGLHYRESLPWSEKQNVPIAWLLCVLWHPGLHMRCPEAFSEATEPSLCSCGPCRGSRFDPEQETPDHRDCGAVVRQLPRVVHMPPRAGLLCWLLGGSSSKLPALTHIVPLFICASGWSSQGTASGVY